MKILIIFAHPKMSDSIVQVKMLGAVRNLEGVTIHDIYAAYPDFLHVGDYKTAVNTFTERFEKLEEALAQMPGGEPSLDVQRQSLELAQESLRNTQARINIGTTPPIDLVEAEAEMATRQEAVILSEAQIDEAERAEQNHYRQEGKRFHDCALLLGCLRLVTACQNFTPLVKHPGPLR